MNLRQIFFINVTGTYNMYIVLLYNIFIKVVDFEKITSTLTLPLA
jgi:hypothetical protein